MKNTIKISCVIALLFVAGFKAFTRDADNNFYFNPLTLDGKTMNLGKLSAITTGKLSVVKIDAESDEKTVLPFVVYLTRNGNVVNPKSNPYDKSVTEIEIGPIMKTAVAGDELVIDPVNNDDKKWRRVILVNPSKSYPKVDWFYRFNKGAADNKPGDGC